MKHYLEMTAQERKEKALSMGKETTWPEAGLIFCEKMQTWCASINLLDGTCKAKQCSMTDKKKIQELKKQIANFRKDSFLEEEYEEGQIKRQTRTMEEISTIKIRKRKEQMMRFFEYGEPKKAQKIMLEINQIERRMKNDR